MAILASSPPSGPGTGSPFAAAPSTAGGILLLAQAWGALGGTRPCLAGIHWRGPGAAVLLFALVVVPLLAARSIRAIAQQCASPDPFWQGLGWAALVSQRRLARFADSPRHCWWTVLGAMVHALAQHPATRLGPEVVLALDTTTVEKRWGPRLAQRHPVYSTVAKKLVDGYELVSRVISDAAGHAWPVGLVAHAPTSSAARRRRAAAPDEAPSKLDEALHLVQLVAATGIRGLVVADGAFAVQWGLAHLRAEGWDFLVATRSDRRLRIGATIQSFATWASHLALVPVAATPRGQIWGGALRAVTLLNRHATKQGLPVQALYFERRDHQGHVTHRWYLVTSRAEAAAGTVWAHWQRRWPVEVFHRDAKQELQLQDFHARTWAGIGAWVAATSLRASLLAWLRASPLLTAQPATLPALVRAVRQRPLLVAPTDRLRRRVLLPGLRAGPPPPPPVPPEWWPLELQAA